jgi:hypothetical protein
MHRMFVEIIGLLQIRHKVSNINNYPGIYAMDFIRNDNCAIVTEKYRGVNRDGIAKSLLSGLLLVRKEALRSWLVFSLLTVFADSAKTLNVASNTQTRPWTWKRFAWPRTGTELLQ